jgi:RHS repeat-associated protein
VVLLDHYYSSDGTWAERVIDLSSYAGQQVRLRFRLDARSHANVADGWYIDDLVIEDTATPPGGQGSIEQPMALGGRHGTGRSAPLGASVATTTRVISYTYDSLYRLTGAEYSTGESFAYTYDAVGNRLSLVTSSGSTSYEYDAANRLTSVNGVVYTWDNNGNLLNDGVRTYAYDHANRLTSVTSGTVITQFSYDGLGNRIATTVDGVSTRYALDMAGGLPEVIVVTTGGASTQYLQVAGQILAQYDSGTWGYILPDHLGSVRAETNALGQVTVARDFDPFGVPLQADGGGPFGYTGEWWDNQAELLYLRARWYASDIGRFTQRDPWTGDYEQPLTLNPYLYVLSNPVNQVDSSGLQVPSNAIHMMIQEKYVATHGLSYPGGVRIEFPIPGGSTTGLTTVTAGQLGQPGFKAQLGGTPTGEVGRADIVGFHTPNFGEIYEIKPKREMVRGIAQLAWYMQVNNANPKQPRLIPGRTYTWSPEEELIGTNPYYAGQEIVATMDMSQAPGVILYRARRKSQQQPSPHPVYVWEWDPEKRKVEKRELVPVYYYAACPSPEIGEIAKKAAGDTVKIGGTALIVWGTIQVVQGVVGFFVAGPPGAVVGVALPP